MYETIWNIIITLCRTFDGTKDEAEEQAQDDYDFYQSQLDGGEFVNFPTDWDVEEIIDRN